MMYIEYMEILLPYAGMLTIIDSYVFGVEWLHSNALSNKKKNKRRVINFNADDLKM